jgi:hypothetical protein
MNAAIAETAQRALWLLRRDGWTKGDWQDKAGRYCLTGALQAAAAMNPVRPGEPSLEKAAYSAVLRVIREQFPGRLPPRWFPFLRVEFFNDGRETTFGDIALVLEKVIASE